MLPYHIRQPDFFSISAITMITFHDNPFLPPIYIAIIYILFTLNYDYHIIIIIDAIQIYFSGYARNSEVDVLIFNTPPRMGTSVSFSNNKGSTFFNGLSYSKYYILQTHHIFFPEIFQMVLHRILYSVNIQFCTVIEGFEFSGYFFMIPVQFEFFPVFERIPNIKSV